MGDFQNVNFGLILPPCDAPEKIILVVDRAESGEGAPFTVSDKQFTPLTMLKNAFEKFVTLKKSINTKHEYAVAVLNEESAEWVLDFTVNTNRVIKALKAITACAPGEALNMNSLLDVIGEKVTVPPITRVEGIIIPPPSVVRAVVSFSRTTGSVVFERNNSATALLEAPFFTLDVLMSQNTVNPDERLEVTTTLQSMDRKGLSYFLSVGRSAKQLFEAMARFLGHPLQRPVMHLP